MKYIYTFKSHILLTITLLWMGACVSKSTQITRENSIQILRQPYLQTALADSISILWRTDAGKSCAVSYREKGKSVWEQAEGTFFHPRIGGLENRVTIHHLHPGTTYEYKILTDGQELKTQTTNEFTAPVSKHTAFNFYTAGDIGEPVDDDGQPDRMAQSIQKLKQQPDFGVLLGDLVYPDGNSEAYDANLFDYFSPVFSHIPTFALLGNHDWHVAPEDNFEQEWKMPGNEHYYSFDYGNTHFIALDSKGGDFYQFDEQKEWLLEELKNTASQSYQWTIVLLHHNGKSCTYKDDTEKVIELYPMFSEYKVDLVLNGHAHTYERLNPMNGQGEPLPEWLDEKKHYQNVEGFISVTVGSGGKLRGIGSDPKPYTPDPENCRHPNLVATASHAWAFMQISIDGNQLKAQTLSSLDRKVLDEFTIEKEPVSMGE